MEDTRQDAYYLDNNLEILAERFPIAAEKIRSAELPNDRRAVQGRKGYPTYQALRQERFINLTSLYDPIHEADLLIQGHDMLESELVFAFGEAGFYHVEAILNAVQERTKVIFISQNPSYVKLVLSTRDVTELLKDERFILAVVEDTKVALQVMVQTVHMDMYRVPVFSWMIHPVESELQSDVMFAMEKSLHSIVYNTVINFNTTAYFERDWSENFLHNIPHVLTGTPVFNLRDSWKGKPVVIVGAGPSLNKNIDLLSRFQDRALILSTDTAFRALQARNIRPSVIVTIDGGAANFANMQDCDFTDVPLVMDAYTHKDIAGGSTAPKVVFISHNLHASWWKQVGMDSEGMEGFGTGGSVATSAFTLAKILGASPIILIGEDLSYPNGEVYADGTVNAGKSLDDVRKQRKLYPVQDAEGNTLYTTVDYLYYLRWFEEQVTTTDSRCINATEGGALHRGFILKTLAETLQGECRELQPVGAWLERISSRHVDDTMLIGVLRRLHDSQRELTRYRTILRILSRYTTDYVAAVESGDNLRQMRVTRNLERGRQLLHRLQLASAFLDGYSFKTIRDDIRLEEQLEKEQDELTEEERATRFAKHSQKLFDELAQRCDDSINMHRTAIENFCEKFQVSLKG